MSFAESPLRGFHSAATAGTQPEPQEPEPQELEPQELEPGRRPQAERSRQFIGDRTTTY